MSKLYTPEEDFRDNGTTWFGRWSQNKNNACIGRGNEMAFDKSMYSDPVRETCLSGQRVVMLERISRRPRSQTTAEA